MIQSENCIKGDWNKNEKIHPCQYRTEILTYETTYKRSSIRSFRDRTTTTTKKSNNALENATEDKKLYTNSVSSKWIEDIHKHKEKQGDW